MANHLLPLFLAPFLLTGCHKKTETDIQAEKAASDLKTAIEKAQTESDLTPDQKKALGAAEKALGYMTDEQKKQLIGIQETMQNLSEDQKKQAREMLKAAGVNADDARKAASEVLKQLQETQGKTGQ